MSLDDAEWLRRRYVTERASVMTIAAEAGRDDYRVYRALRRHGIPARGAHNRDRSSWGEVLTADAMRAWLRGGEPLSAIARRVGCDWSTAHHWAGVHGLLGGDPDAGEADQLRGWYLGDRLSLREIAGRLDVSRREVSRRLQRAGIALRPAGRPVRGARHHREVPGPAAADAAPPAPAQR
jgi:transposase-like protein